MTRQVGSKRLSLVKLRAETVSGGLDQLLVDGFVLILLILIMDCHRRICAGYLMGCFTPPLSATPTGTWALPQQPCP